MRGRDESQRPKRGLGCLVDEHTVHQAKKDGRSMFQRTVIVDIQTRRALVTLVCSGGEVSTDLHLRVLSPSLGSMEER